ncbi:MAG: ROK family transcriptional regulator [Chloroflexota bacterium]|nr:ROK family transcriptional regulator [Chloroflexota bacterium]
MEKATHKKTKAHNSRLILNTIYNQGEISRADIARTTGLTRSTVSKIVSGLMAEGLVKEIGQGQSSGGKPPTLLGVNGDAYDIIGIDLASGEFRGAIISLRGDIKYRQCLSVEGLSGKEALAVVFELTDQLLGLAKNPVLGIGIGAPGLMNPEDGIVINAVNLDWQALPMGQILSQRYQLPVSIANDCQVSALAEYLFGEHEPSTDLVVVKVGRGVGAGIVLNGAIYHGEGFGAGEIGHVKVEKNGVLCNCGNYGCLETKVSSRAIRRIAKIVAREHPDSALNQNVSKLDDITLDQIIRAYQHGDAHVEKIVQELAQDLAKALSFSVSVLNIQHVVIAGSVSGLGQGLVSLIDQYLHGSVLTPISENTEITISSLGVNIVTLGAAAIILQQELGIVSI